MNENTIIRTMPLPFGQPWAWYGDLNVVVLSPCLDAAGREAALDAVQAHWRRSCLRVVSDDEREGLPGLVTEPMNIVATLSAGRG